MPALGVAQETGKLLRWLKAEGEHVTAGDPVMEIETDKVTVEIEAPASGVLGGIRAAEGDDVPVGDVIALILAEGEATPAESDATPDAARGEAGSTAATDEAPAAPRGDAPSPASPEPRAPQRSPDPAG